MLAVKAFDYVRSDEPVRAEIDEAVRRVLSSGTLLLGPETESFEREFAAWVGSRAAVAVASGTDAISIALRALNVGPGDEVITVAHTAVPTVGAVRELGAVPRFVDVDDESLVIDHARIESAIGPRTRAILPVHLYGRPCNMAAVLQIASRHRLPVVEDCAQAHGARIDGRHVGTFGTIGCFSFYPTKNLGAYGDGGLCLTDDEQLAQRIRRIRFHGFDADRIAQVEGVNSRLDELQAAVLRVKLRHLDGALQARREIVQRYRELLSETPLRLPAIEPAMEHAWHLFVIRTPARARLLAAFQRARIGFGIHYPCPVHLMPAYERFGGGAGSLPVTERAAEEVLSLPLFPGLREDEIRMVCRVIRRASVDAAAGIAG